MLYTGTHSVILTSDKNHFHQENRNLFLNHPYYYHSYNELVDLKYHYDFIIKSRYPIAAFSTIDILAN